MKIFVQITSYRDTELYSTVKDCLSKAYNPRNLNFGICLQDEINPLNEFVSDPRFKIIDMHWKDSRGVGLAKSLSQSLYDGEEYTLHIDSHHRFEKNWDEILIKMINNIDSQKPILSSFAGSYRSSNGEKLSIEPYKISITGFDDNGLPILRPDPISDWEKLDKPIRARFLCGHFLFARGSFCGEYKYDPEIYFEGNDISLSARCFTMGYDLFHPNKNVLWHEYKRTEKRKHWLDNPWEHLDEKSKNRVKKLLENNDTDLGEFGLGSARTLEDYQIYTGIDFSKKMLNDSSIKGNEPSIILENKDEWAKSLIEQIEPGELKQHSLEVSWSKEEIEFADDYEFWFFGFHDDEGKEIYRKDFNKEANKDFLEFKKTNIEVTFRSKKEPKSCLIWPYSASRGWLSRLEARI